MSLFDWMEEVVEKHGFTSSDATEGSTAGSGGSNSRSAAAPDYTLARIVQGGGGYVYAQWSDDELVIMEGPGGAKDQRVKRNTKAWQAITEEIGTYSGDPLSSNGAATATSPSASGDAPAGESSSLDYTLARIIHGGGGYVYAQWSDDELVIMEGPGGEKDQGVKRNTKAWQAITAEIGTYHGGPSGSPATVPTSSSENDQGGATPTSDDPHDEWNGRVGEYSVLAMQVAHLMSWSDSGYGTEIKVLQIELSSISDAVDKEWWEQALIHLNRSLKMIKPIYNAYQAHLAAGGSATGASATTREEPADPDVDVPGTDIPSTTKDDILNGVGAATDVLGVADAAATLAGAAGTAAHVLGAVAPFLQFAGFALIIEKRGDDLYQAVMSRGFAYGVVAEAAGTKVGSPSGGGQTSKKAFAHGVRLGREAFKKAASKAPSEEATSSSSLEEHLNAIHKKVIKGLFDESFLGVLPGMAPIGQQEQGCKLRWPGPSWSGTCVMP